MPTQTSTGRPFWLLLTLLLFLLAMPPLVLATPHPLGLLTSSGRDQYAIQEFLVVTSFRVLYLDSAADKQVGLDRKVQAPPIRHFEGATAKNFQEKIAHKKYHQVCDRQSPKGLSLCEEANWKYKQAKACLQAREAWEARWGRPDTQAPHGRALKNVRARLKNAITDKERLCGIE
ncbi:hypothetical protein ACG1BZ_14005 [Microbulbifer sp. CNSA002]|uniref:hypothetical protein n=1 Tax=Microbulbifer sp. CNSA002 TaxID=3373604 RepID=UPI0039B5EC52